MKARELRNLLNRAAAALESNDLGSGQIEELIEDLTADAGEVEAPRPILTLEETPNGFLVTDNTGPTPSRIACNTLAEGLAHLCTQAGYAAEVQS